MRKYLWLLLWFAVVLVSACSNKKEAIGEANELLVVADSSLYATVHPELSATFEKVLYTPWSEKIFNLRYTPPKNLGQASVRHYIVMLGLLDASDKTSQQVRGMLSAPLLAQVENAESFVFRKESPWSKGQLLLVLVAKDVATLKNKLVENKDYVFSLLWENSLERTEKEMYARLEQVDVEKQLLEKYGWRVRVQHDYIIYREESSANFVMLRRTSPERWLFVTWVDGKEPDIITKEWMLQKRNEIGELFYEGDVVVDSLLSVHETEVGDHWALEIDGLWENNEKVAGGPFKSFALFDETKRRAYLIDGAVFAPGQDKEPFVRQLEVMARTFRTAADLAYRTADSSTK